MGRPVLALGLIAIAVLLLGSLFAELEDSMVDPEPFEPDAQALQKAAETAAQHPEYLETAAEAGALELAEDTEITIPPGAAEIDGDLIRLLSEVAWTLPAGTEVEDLTLPLPPGTEIHLPSGTRIDGDTLVFPPDSSIVLEDGTVLQLPEGGHLRVPGADAVTLREHIADGTFTIPDAGGIFTGPQVRNHDAWPTTLPPGTTFGIPDGLTLPEGTWHEGGTFTLPAGHPIDPDAGAGATDGTKEGLFEKIGKLDLKPPEPKTEGTTGGTDGPGFHMPGRATLYWLLGAAVAAVGIFLLWRHRVRLRGLFGRTIAPLAGTAPRIPFRLIATIGSRPERLPLALAPGETGDLHIRFEARDSGNEGALEGWHAVPAEITVRLGEEVLYRGTATASGIAITMPVLPAGDHQIRFDVQIAGHRTMTLAETLRVAPWSEQVARDYDRLAQAVGKETRLPAGFTPRVLEAHALPTLPSVAHARLSAALAVFERANYSQGTISELDWVTMAATVEGIASTLRRRQRPPTRQQTEVRPGKGHETA